MKSILLKLDDELFKEIEESAKELKTSKTDFIKKAVISFKKAYHDRKIEIQLAKESALVRKDSMEINAFFESTLLDGLIDD